MASVPDDAILMARAGNGDPASLAALYRRHAPAVFGFALRSTGSREAAEEVTQDVFDRVWRGAAGYRADRASAATWIMRIARNRAIDELRRTGRRPAEAPGPWEDSLGTDPGTGPEEITEANQERRSVREAVARLPRAQREALELAFFGGLSHAEIARSTGVPVGTVKTRIRLSMRKLREVLEGEGEQR